MDSLFVGVYVVHVDPVLRSRRVQGAEFQQDLDCPLVFCDSDAFGALPFEVNGLLGVSDG